MQHILEKLKPLEGDGTFDMIMDPEVGRMELQEIGIAEQMSYSDRERFFYAHNVKGPVMQKVILYIASNLGITGEETEIEDRMAETVTRLDVEFDEVTKGIFWVTYWYDGGVGSIHRQDRMEFMLTFHADKLPDRYDFYDTRKKHRIQKIARDCLEDFPKGLPMDDFNEYVKEKNLQWILEDVLMMGYDVWDFLSDINREMGIQ